MYYYHAYLQKKIDKIEQAKTYCELDQSRNQVYQFMNYFFYYNSLDCISIQSLENLQKIIRKYGFNIGDGKNFKGEVIDHEVWNKIVSDLNYHQPGFSEACRGIYSKLAQHKKYINSASIPKETKNQYKTILEQNDRAFLIGHTISGLEPAAEEYQKALDCFQQKLLNKYKPKIEKTITNINILPYRDVVNDPQIITKTQQQIQKLLLLQRVYGVEISNLSSMKDFIAECIKYRHKKNYIPPEKIKWDEYVKIDPDNKKKDLEKSKRFNEWLLDERSRLGYSPNRINLCDTGDTPICFREKSMYSECRPDMSPCDDVALGKDSTECQTAQNHLVTHYQLIGQQSMLSKTIKDMTWGRTLQNYVEMFDFKTPTEDKITNFMKMLRFLFYDTKPFEGLRSSVNSLFSNKPFPSRTDYPHNQFGILLQLIPFEIIENYSSIVDRKFNEMKQNEKRKPKSEEENRRIRENQAKPIQDIVRTLLSQQSQTNAYNQARAGCEKHASALANEIKKHFGIREEEKNNVFIKPNAAKLRAFLMEQSFQDLDPLENDNLKQILADLDVLEGKENTERDEKAKLEKIKQDIDDTNDKIIIFHKQLYTDIQLTQQNFANFIYELETGRYQRENIVLNWVYDIYSSWAQGSDKDDITNLFVALLSLKLHQMYPQINFYQRQQDGKVLYRNSCQALYNLAEGEATSFQRYTTTYSAMDVACCQEDTAYNYAANIIKNSPNPQDTFLGTFWDRNAPKDNSPVSHDKMFTDLMAAVMHQKDMFKSIGVEYYDDRKDMRALPQNFLRLVHLLIAQAAPNLYALPPKEEAKGEEAKGEEAKGEEAKGEEAKGEEAKDKKKKAKKAKVQEIKIEELNKLAIERQINFVFPNKEAAKLLSQRVLFENLQQKVQNNGIQASHVFGMVQNIYMLRRGAITYQISIQNGHSYNMPTSTKATGDHDMYPRIFTSSEEESALQILKKIYSSALASTRYDTVVSQCRQPNQQRFGEHFEKTCDISGLYHIANSPRLFADASKKNIQIEDQHMEAYLNSTKSKGTHMITEVCIEVLENLEKLQGYLSYLNSVVRSREIDIRRLRYSVLLSLGIDTLGNDMRRARDLLKERVTQNSGEVALLVQNIEQFQSQQIQRTAWANMVQWNSATNDIINDALGILAQFGIINTEQYNETKKKIQKIQQIYGYVHMKTDAI